MGIVLAALSFLVHLLPFLLYSHNPLGYDTGFYRRYLTEPFVSFPNTSVPGLGANAVVPRIILDTLRAIHLSPEMALYGSYVFFWILLPVLFFYWLSPRLGRRGAFSGAILLTLSPVGYTAFWFMLYKNALALCFLLLAFIAFERKWFWGLIALDVLIPVSHETSSVIYGATLFFLLFFARECWKEILLHLSVTGIVFLAVNLSAPKEVLARGAVAVFIEWRQYLTLSIPLFFAAAFAIPIWRTVKEHATLLAFTVASFIFPIFSLPFHERIFVFTDVALVALATYGLTFIWTKIDLEASSVKPYFYFCALLVICGFTLGNFESQVKILQPLESDANLQTIQEIGTHLPENASLLTSTDEAPWYEGWTAAHIAAPGMLRDTHNLEAWTAFWNSTSTNARAAFLATFPQPLYISTLVDMKGFFGSLPPCFETITPNLLKDSCIK